MKSRSNSGQSRNRKTKNRMQRSDTNASISSVSKTSTSKSKRSDGERSSSSSNASIPNNQSVFMTPTERVSIRKDLRRRTSSKKLNSSSRLNHKLSRRRNSNTKKYSSVVDDLTKDLIVTVNVDKSEEQKKFMQKVLDHIQSSGDTKEIHTKFMNELKSLVSEYKNDKREMNDLITQFRKFMNSRSPTKIRDYGDNTSVTRLEEEDEKMLTQEQKLKLDRLDSNTRLNNELMRKKMGMIMDEEEKSADINSQIEDNLNIMDDNSRSDSERSYARDRLENLQQIERNNSLQKWKRIKNWTSSNTPNEINTPQLLGTRHSPVISRRDIENITNNVVGNAEIPVDAVQQFNVNRRNFRAQDEERENELKQELYKEISNLADQNIKLEGMLERQGELIKKLSNEGTVNNPEQFRSEMSDTINARNQGIRNFVRGSMELQEGPETAISKEMNGLDNLSESGSDKESVYSSSTEKSAEEIANEIIDAENEQLRKRTDVQKRIANYNRQEPVEQMNEKLDKLLKILENNANVLDKDDAGNVQKLRENPIRVNGGNEPGIRQNMSNLGSTLQSNMNPYNNVNVQNDLTKIKTNLKFLTQAVLSNNVNALTNKQISPGGNLNVVPPKLPPYPPSLQQRPPSISPNQLRGKELARLIPNLQKQNISNRKVENINRQILDNLQSGNAQNDLTAEFNAFKNIPDKDKSNFSRTVVPKTNTVTGDIVSSSGMLPGLDDLRKNMKSMSDVNNKILAEIKKLNMTDTKLPIEEDREKSSKNAKIPNSVNPYNPNWSLMFEKIINAVKRTRLEYGNSPNLSKLERLLLTLLNERKKQNSDRTEWLLQELGSRKDLVMGNETSKKVIEQEALDILDPYSTGEQIAESLKKLLSTAEREEILATLQRIGDGTYTSIEGFKDAFQNQVRVLEEILFRHYMKLTPEDRNYIAYAINARSVELQNKLNKESRFSIEPGYVQREMSKVLQSVYKQVSEPLSKWIERQKLKNEMMYATYINIIGVLLTIQNQEMQNDLMTILNKIPVFVNEVDLIGELVESNPTLMEKHQVETLFNLLRKMRSILTDNTDLIELLNHELSTLSRFEWIPSNLYQNMPGDATAFDILERIRNVINILRVRAEERRGSKFGESQPDDSSVRKELAKFEMLDKVVRGYMNYSQREMFHRVKSEIVEFNTIVDTLRNTVVTFFSLVEYNEDLKTDIDRSIVKARIKKGEVSAIYKQLKRTFDPEFDRILQREISDLTDVLEHVVSEYNEALQQYNNTPTTNIITNNVNKYSTTNTSISDKQLSALQSQINTLNTTLVNVKKGYETEIDNLKSELNQARRANDNYKNDNLIQKLTDRIVNLEFLVKNRPPTQTQSVDFTPEISALKNQINDLMQNPDKNEESIKILNAALESLKTNNLNQLNTQINELELAIDSLKAQPVYDEDRVNSLEQTLTTLKSFDLQDMLRRIEALEQQDFSVYEQRLEAIEQDKEQQINDYKQKLKDALDKIADEKTRLNALLQQANDNADMIRQEKTDLENKNAKLETDIADLETRLNTQQPTADPQELLDLQKKFKQAQDDLDTVKGEKDDLEIQYEQQLATLKTAEEAARNSSAQLQSELDQLKLSGRSEDQDKIQDLETENTKLSQLRKALEDEQTQLRKDLNDIKAENLKNESKLNAMKKKEEDRRKKEEERKRKEEEQRKKEEEERNRTCSEEDIRKIESYKGTEITNSTIKLYIARFKDVRKKMEQVRNGTLKAAPIAIQKVTENPIYQWTPSQYEQELKNAKKFSGSKLPNLVAGKTPKKICTDALESLKNLINMLEVIDDYENLNGIGKVLVKTRSFVPSLDLKGLSPQEVAQGKRDPLKVLTKFIYPIYNEGRTSQEVLVKGCFQKDQTYGMFTQTFIPEQYTQIINNKYVYNPEYSSLGKISDTVSTMTNKFYSMVFLSYGLSGSGKTYTLLGDLKSGKEEGMIQMAINQISTILRYFPETEVSAVQVYNGKIYDCNPDRDITTFKFEKESSLGTEGGPRPGVKMFKKNDLINELRTLVTKMVNADNAFLKSQTRNQLAKYLNANFKTKLNTMKYDLFGKDIFKQYPDRETENTIVNKILTVLSELEKNESKSKFNYLIELLNMEDVSGAKFDLSELVEIPLNKGNVFDQANTEQIRSLKEFNTFLNKKIMRNRLTRGTLSNPDSSRSHLFIRVRMKNRSENKWYNLYVSDLAGAEKPFEYTGAAAAEGAFVLFSLYEIQQIMRNYANFNLVKLNQLGQEFEKLQYDFDFINGGLAMNRYKKAQSMNFKREFRKQVDNNMNLNGQATYIVMKDILNWPLNDEEAKNAKINKVITFINTKQFYPKGDAIMGKNTCITTAETLLYGASLMNSNSTNEKMSINLEFVGQNSFGKKKRKDGGGRRRSTNQFGNTKLKENLKVSKADLYKAQVDERITPNEYKRILSAMGRTGKRFDYEAYMRMRRGKAVSIKKSVQAQNFGRRKRSGIRVNARRERRVRGKSLKKTRQVPKRKFSRTKKRIDRHTSILRRRRRSRQGG